MNQIDYDTPRFTFREAAAASGFEHNTLRSHFQRGVFRVIGGVPGGGRGLPTLFNLRDVLALAVSQRLRALGVDPEPSFTAGVDFAHTASEGRDPAALFRGADLHTVLVYHPATRRAEFKPLPEKGGLSLTDLFFDFAYGRQGTAVVVWLDVVERDVFTALGEKL